MASLDVIATRCREVDLGGLTRPRPTGVYLLILDGIVVYVGQSTDVEMRIALHLKEDTKVFDRAIWIELDRSELDAYEGALIRVFDPRYSYGAPVDIGRDDEVLAKLGLTTDEDARRSFAARRRSRLPKTRAINRRRSRAVDDTEDAP